MSFLYYILGIITGAIITGFVRRHEDRVAKVIEKPAESVFGPKKGTFEIIETIDEVEEAMQETIKRNEEKGVDTQL